MKTLSKNRNTSTAHLGVLISWKCSCPALTWSVGCVGGPFYLCYGAAKSVEVCVYPVTCFPGLQTRSIRIHGTSSHQVFYKFFTARVLLFPKAVFFHYTLWKLLFTCLRWIVCWVNTSSHSLQHPPPRNVVTLDAAWNGNWFWPPGVRNTDETSPHEQDLCNKSELK